MALQQVKSNSDTACRVGALLYKSSSLLVASSHSTPPSFLMPRPPALMRQPPQRKCAERAAHTPTPTPALALALALVVAASRHVRHGVPFSTGPCRAVDYHDVEIELRVCRVELAEFRPSSVNLDFRKSARFRLDF